jgi:hypothetical protein
MASGLATEDLRAEGPVEVKPTAGSAESWTGRQVHACLTAERAPGSIRFHACS